MSGAAGGTRATLSRRQLLKASAVGTAAAGVGVSMAACSSEAASSSVTLQLPKTGYYGFFGAMPSAEERKASTQNEAYAATLQAWLDKNPGVKLEPINVDIWDQKAITTAVAGRTAPAFYSGNALGNWQMSSTYTAFSQGLAADVTSQFEKSGMLDKLADYAKPIWESNWKVDGKYYGAPQGYSVGDGMYYRRDLMAQMGIPEPTNTWTWSDVRALAAKFTDGKRHGFAFPQWQMSFNLSTSGLGLLTALPDPGSGWNWKYDYTSLIDRWRPQIEDLRAMMYTDKSGLSDVTYNTWTPIESAFLQDKVAMRAGNLAGYVSDPKSATSPNALAKKIGKPLDEVVGWITYPVDATGYVPSGGGQPTVGCASFSPDLGKDELTTAFDLFAYLIGDGMVAMAKAAFDSTKDLRQVYNESNLRPVLAATIDELPGSLEEAWGQKFSASVEAAGKRALTPWMGGYIPAESTAGPNLDDPAATDAMNKMTYENKGVDIMGTLQHLQDVQNTQAKSVTSSIPDDKFVSGVRNYYAAMSDYAKANCPQFATEVFQPWYDKFVTPAIGS